MESQSLQNLVIFSFRMPIFLDFTILQLSKAQLDLSSALREIDTATTQKRDLHTILHTVDAISTLIAEIVRVKTCFTLTRLPACRELIRRRPAAVLARMETVDWFSCFNASGNFNLYIGGAPVENQGEPDIVGSNLLDLGGKMSGIDLQILEILGIVLAVGFAAEAAAVLGKSFFTLAPVSIGTEEERERIVRQIVRLSHEIREHVEELCAIFKILCCLLGDGGVKEGEP